MSCHKRMHLAVSGWQSAEDILQKSWIQSKIGSPCRSQDPRGFGTAACRHQHQQHSNHQQSDPLQHDSAVRLLQVLAWWRHRAECFHGGGHSSSSPCASASYQSWVHSHNTRNILRVHSRQHSLPQWNGVCEKLRRDYHEGVPNCTRPSSSSFTTADFALHTDRVIIRLALHNATNSRNSWTWTSMFRESINTHDNKFCHSCWK